MKAKKITIKPPYDPERILHLFEYYLPDIKHLSCLIVGEPSVKISQLLTNHYLFKVDTYKDAKTQVDKKKEYDVVISLFCNSKPVIDSLPYLVRRDGYLFIFSPNLHSINLLKYNFVLLRRLPTAFTALNSIKKYDKFLSNLGYSPLLRDVVGHFKLSIFKPRNNKQSKFFRTADRMGKLIPNSRIYSPYIAYIYHKDNLPRQRYISEYSFRKRIPRVYGRMTYFIKGGGLRRLLGVVEKPLLKLRLNSYKQTKELEHLHLGFTERLLLKSKLYRYRQTRVIEKPQLLICLTWLQVGGVERVILNLIEDIKRDFDVHIITSLPNDNLWESEFKKHTFRILHLSQMTSPKNQPWFIAEYVKKARVDSMLITNNIPAYKAIPLIRSFAKKVIIIDLLHTHGRPEEHDAFLPISMPFNKMINKRVVISNYLKNYYCSKYPVSKEHVQVIYNSINHKLINTKTDSQKWIKKLKKGNKDFLISFVSRLTVDKNPFRLLEIAKIIVKDLGYSNVIFAVAGDVELGDRSIAEKMKNTIKDWGLQNDVVMLGNINDPLNLMAASDLTILTSDMEGIPMSVLESMAVGTPVIAPSVGGIPEIIDNNVDGYLIPMDTIGIPERFACQIEKILKNTSGNKKVALKTKRKIAKKFTKTSDEYLTLLTSK